MVPKGRNEMKPPEVWSQELENHQEQACSLHDSVPPSLDVSAPIHSLYLSAPMPLRLPFLQVDVLCLSGHTVKMASVPTGADWCLCDPVWILAVENVVGRAWLRCHQEPIIEEQGIWHHRVCRDFGNPTLRKGGVVGWAAPSDVGSHWGQWELAEIRGLNREGNGTPRQSSCLENPMDGGAWWAAVHGVAKSRTRLSCFTFTFHFHALEKEMATHSSVLAWRIPGTGEPGGLPSMESHGVGHDWSNLAAAAAGV